MLYWQGGRSTWRLEWRRCLSLINAILARGAGVPGGWVEEIYILKPCYTGRGSGVPGGWSGGDVHPKTMLYWQGGRSTWWMEWRRCPSLNHAILAGGKEYLVGGVKEMSILKPCYTGRGAGVPGGWSGGGVHP